MVQSDSPSEDTVERDDPLHFLFSDSDSSDEVRQVRVLDTGSKPHCAKVNVQGILMEGVHGRQWGRQYHHGWHYV